MCALNFRVKKGTPDMTDFDRKKLSEIFLYILCKTGGVDYYHAFKILYFAEMNHLAKWGSGIVPDKFCALKYGPVPTALYDAVKELGNPRLKLSEELSSLAQYAGEDAPNILLPRKEVNMDYISRSEKEALDKSIEEHESMTFGQLLVKSHDAAWAEAHHRVNGNNIISPISMAKVMNADAAILEYIEEQMQIEEALG